MVFKKGGKKKIEKFHWPFEMRRKRLSCCKSLPARLAGFDLCSPGCVGHAHPFHPCCVEALQQPPQLGASHPAPGAVPGSSWLLSASLLQFHRLWHQPGHPTQNHCIRSVTCTLHKWCVGAGTSWGEWSHGLSKNRLCSLCQNE